MINKFLDLQRKLDIKLLVVGDCMHDHYHDVQVNRISPEIPAVIMSSPNEECRRLPGGAANVCYGLKNFNVDVKLASIMSPADYNYFQSCGIKINATVGEDVKIPIKKRFVCNGFQKERWDIEQPNFGLNKEYFKSYYQNFLQTLKYETDCNVVIFSDYNKGLFVDSKIPELFKDKLTIVDPKKGPLEKWYGCTVIKPNAAEAKELTGESDSEAQCRVIMEKTNCKTVIITQGGGGFVGVNLEYPGIGSFFSYTPDKKVQVESVVGAGDTFGVFLALAMGCGFSSYDAGVIAYKAGALYVQNRLNRPIVPAELSETKVVHPLDLRKRDFTLAFANGCFDLLHVGHLSTLAWSKKQADKLVVALNSDESIARLKGPERPIIPLDQRVQLIAALGCVDFVVTFDEDTPLDIIKQCMPDIICKGSDYEGKDIVGSDLAKIGCAPYIEGISTTNIINKII